jgi:hypothetical protein
MPKRSLNGPEIADKLKVSAPSAFAGKVSAKLQSLRHPCEVGGSDPGRPCGQWIGSP